MRYLRSILFFALLAILGWFFLGVDSFKPLEKPLLQWKVHVDRSKHKSESAYDVIVVGGGFGGLSAGALLAKNGYKVLVVEKNAEIGGLCSSYTKDGYHFCYGAEDIGGLFERGPLEYLLRELNFDKSAFFVPNTRRFIVDNTFLDVASDQIVDVLVEKFAKEKDSIHRFFDYAEKVLNQAYDSKMIHQWGIRVPSNLIPEIMPPQWIKDYPLTHKEFIEWQGKSYQDVLDEYFHDSDLKKMLSNILIGYFGGRPIKVSAATVVVTCFEYFFYGGNHALQTPQHFANALSDFIEKKGGRVLVNTKAEQIVVDERGVKGVQVQNRLFTAPLVMSNVNAKTTYRDLVDSKFLPQGFVSEITALPMGGSVFALHLGVNDLLSSYPALIQDKDNQVFVAISSKNDRSLAPEGQSAVVIRETARFGDFIGRSSAELQEYLYDRTARLLERGIALIPELKDSTVVERVLTPVFYEELANIPSGSIYGFDESRVPVCPYFKSPIPGLYLSNAFIGGPGVTSVVRNGILCAQDIMGWPQSNP